jgi:predicted SnoaL-like aldol condensation-catalyzing enzyme
MRDMTDVSDAARQARMVDIFEIRELAQRYAVAVTFHDVDAMAELFDPQTDNGKWGTGQEGVKAFYTDFFGRNQRHELLQVGTHQVDLIDDAHATGVCFTRSWAELQPGSWSDVMVVYFDTYRKADGRWGFVHRKETLHDIARPSLADAVPVPMQKHWEYLERWNEKKASGTLFRR